MDKTLFNTLLYDFYGELLSEKQKQIYEMYFLNDYSLMEISECVGISRQGVRDNIVRCEKALLNYEDKLSLVASYLKRKEELDPLILEIDSHLSAHSGNDVLCNTLEKTKNYLLDFFT